MLILALVLAIVAVYLIQYRIYRDKSFDGITYDVTLSAGEVFEGEDVFFSEVISNTRFLPLPFVKVDTALPEGLSYRLIDSGQDGSRTGRLASSVQSVFVLRPYQKITRTWRVNCGVRGEYSLGQVMIVTNDLIGFNQQSRMITVRPTAKNRLVVLPRTVELEKEFTASLFLSGEILVQRSIVSDPLRLCGIREYAVGDPMNHINWKSTAAKGMLMVNLEEFTQRFQFNLVMNMNSRDIEHVPGPPAMPYAVESCITVVASILDAVASENIQVSLITNTLPPDTPLEETAITAEGDEVGAEIFLSRPHAGTHDMLEVLRMLASLPMHIGVSVEKMLDHIIAHPEVYTAGGNLVFVSAYLSERMINFAYTMRSLGIEVIFYITTANNNAMIIPDDIRVVFKTYFE
ncbi:MAG: DUF58 domain-containing protein [Ruminococcaceae bacterium]|nr:DUF58 domain-containing protein [Oscillospiraceae bacterium]